MPNMIFIFWLQAGDGIYGYVAPETNIANNPNSPSLAN
jgi:hypothetical protein